MFFHLIHKRTCYCGDVSEEEEFEHNVHYESLPAVAKRNPVNRSTRTLFEHLQILSQGFCLLVNLLTS